MTTAQQHIAPREIVCVIDHMWRDLAVADDAVQGRFTHAGLTLDLGRRPDWRAPIGHDEEWRIEWVKLYEGLDLGHAFATTGKPMYLAAWQDLVESFCSQVPVGYDTSDVTARRLQNWTYAWARFAQASAFDGLRPGLSSILLERIAGDAEHLAGHLTTERNHRTLELYALLVVALAFPELDPDGERARRSIIELDGNLRADVWDDGVHRECSTDYHMIVLRSFLGTIANARRAELALPDGYLDRVSRACDVGLHLQRPDGLTPALSDGDVGDFRELLRLAADLLDRDDLRWAATMGQVGRPPDSRNVSFPVGGYHVQRSGWGDRSRAYSEERFCVFDCGPVGDGGHGHYDQLSIEAFGAGGPLVVDPGRYVYTDEGGDWRRWFKGTAAHNTVTVDGADQTPYRRGRPKQPSAATFLGRRTIDGLDVITGRTESQVYEAVHTRAVAFVADDFWIVVDHLRSERPHRYELRWHLADRAHGLTTLHVRPGTAAVVAPGVRIVLDVAAKVWLDDGWVSQTYGVKRAAPVIVAAVDGDTRANLISVLVPGDRDVDVRTDEIDLLTWRGRVVVDGIAHNVGWSGGQKGIEQLMYRASA